MDSIIQYLAGWNLAAIICLVVGIGLMICEMFTPGFGLFGGIGLLALIASVVLRARTLADALVTVAIILVLLGIAAFFIFRSFGKGGLSRSPIVLTDAIAGESSEVDEPELKAMVGREGVCLNTLRPSGNADFEGRKLDVVSAGEFIQKGARVRIESVEGLKILVKEIRA